MRGVINLRGSVVPVVDLRLKFGMSKTDKTINTCVIIVEVQIDNETTLLGALADSVQEFLELEPEQIDAPPRIGTRLNTAFITGDGERDEDFIIILDIDKVFTARSWNWPRGRKRRHRGLRAAGLCPRRDGDGGVTGR